MRIVAIAITLALGLSACASDPTCSCHDDVCTNCKGTTPASPGSDGSAEDAADANEVSAAVADGGPEAGDAGPDQWDGCGPPPPSEVPPAPCKAQ